MIDYSDIRNIDLFDTFYLALKLYLIGYNFYIGDNFKIIYLYYY